VEKVAFNNFKAFGEHLQKFTLKPITLVYGPNSIGKSSLLHLLAYRSQIMNGSLDPKTLEMGERIDLSGFLSFVHHKDRNRSITLAIGNEIEQIVIVIGFPPNEDIVTCLKAIYLLNDEKIVEAEYIAEKKYRAMLNMSHPKLRKALEATRKNEGWNDENFAVAINEPIDVNIKIDNILKYVYSDYYNDDQRERGYIDHYIGRVFNTVQNWTYFAEISKKKINEFGKIHILENYLDSFEKKEVERKENSEENKEIIIDTQFTIFKDENPSVTLQILMKQLTADLIRAINQKVSYTESIKRFHYTGPMRFYPERYDTVHTTLSKNEILNSKNFWVVLKEYEELRKIINHWLSDEKLMTPYEAILHKRYDLTNLFKRNKTCYTKDDIENHAISTKELLFRDKRNDTPVHNREMGLGVTQILPIIGVLNLAEKNTIAIEQPELHLHPRIQAEIADELIRSYKKRENTLVVETHSEHLILRIMRRMRQTAEGTLEDEELSLTPDDVAVLYVDNDGKTTYIQEIRLSPGGRLLDHWPNGFFEEGFKERFF